MLIMKHITTIVILIALHQSPVAWAEGEDTSSPQATPQQKELQTIPESPSTEGQQTSPAPLIKQILSSPTDTASNPQAAGQEMGFVDMLHREISQRLLTTAVWLDSFFEDERVL